MDRAMMLSAYIRRQEWIAQRQALHTIKLLGEALGGKKGRRKGRQAERVPTAAMFGQLGQQV